MDQESSKKVMKANTKCFSRQNKEEEKITVTAASASHGKPEVCVVSVFIFAPIHLYLI